MDVCLFLEGQTTASSGKERSDLVKCQPSGQLVFSKSSAMQGFSVGPYSWQAEYLVVGNSEWSWFMGIYAVGSMSATMTTLLMCSLCLF